MYACSLYCKTLLLILHCTVSFNHELIIYRIFINDQHNVHEDGKKRESVKRLYQRNIPICFVWKTVTQHLIMNRFLIGKC